MNNILYLNLIIFSFGQVIEGFGFDEYVQNYSIYQDAFIKTIAMCMQSVNTTDISNFALSDYKTSCELKVVVIIN